MVFLALLRGINVSGQKKINMKDLQKLMEDTGFSKVQTYIQSGNLVFSSRSANPSAVKNKIENAIQEYYGFNVTVIIRTLNQMDVVLQNNPYIKKEAGKLYVTFLESEPGDKTEIQLPPGEKGEYTIKGSEIYLYTPEGYGGGKLDNNFLERKLKIKATTRNWNSCIKLTELLKTVIN